jgi:hypothetical protein
MHLMSTFNLIDCAFDDDDGLAYSENKNKRTPTFFMFICCGCLFCLLMFKP